MILVVCCNTFSSKIVRKSEFVCANQKNNICGNLQSMKKW